MDNVLLNPQGKTASDLFVNSKYVNGWQIFPNNQNIENPKTSASQEEPFEILDKFEILGKSEIIEESEVIETQIEHEFDYKKSNS